MTRITIERLEELIADVDGELVPGCSEWSQIHLKLRADKLAALHELRAYRKEGWVLDKPARIGNTTFCVGIAWSTVIGRAQREHEYAQRTVQPLTPEERDAFWEAMKSPREHDLSPNCWCEPRQDDEEPTLWIHSDGSKLPAAPEPQEEPKP